MNRRLLPASKIALVSAAVGLLSTLVHCGGVALQDPFADGGGATPTPPSSDSGAPSDATLPVDSGPQPSDDAAPPPPPPPPPVDAGESPCVTNGGTCTLPGQCTGFTTGDSCGSGGGQCCRAASVDSGGGSCASMGGTCEPVSSGACPNGRLYTGTCASKSDHCCQAGIDAGGNDCVTNGGWCVAVTQGASCDGGSPNQSYTCGGIGSFCCM